MECTPPPEFLVYRGPKTQWLEDSFSDMMETSVITSEFKRTKIIAILNPGKNSELPEYYRPIALLRSCRLDLVSDAVEAIKYCS